MQITLARIDDRLIHGQVTTVWSKVANAQMTMYLTMRFAGPCCARRLRQA